MPNPRFEVTGLRETQKFLPGQGFVKAISIGFVTPTGYAGTVDVTEAQANDPAQVDAAICAYIDKIDAIRNL